MATEPGHATEVTTAYPLPPKYFSLYTDANVAEFPEYQRDRAETDKAQDAFSKAVTAATAGLEDSSKSISASAGSAPKYLHPPRPIEGAYSMFGADHTTDSKLKTLRELGIPQFFPDGPIEYKPVLKNLIQSLLADLHKYLEILGTRTEEFEPQKDRIWHLLQNIHHVINEYRPHQARDMLCLVMEEDIRKKQDMAKRLQE
ncbi:mediator complex, subunit Med7 [Powellomyces hirtus]|nr:mediator complex, subunit Med7 [Powellomyces hirtus]